MELFQRLGFADATLIVAVSATSLRAVGNVISGFIVIFKGTQINQNGSTYVILVIVRIFLQIGRRYSLLLSCTGSVLCIELASGSFLLKDFIKDPVIGMICDYSLLITIPAFMFFLGMGITPVPWILLGEWFVSETRSFIGGIGSATFFLSALISLQVGIFFCHFVQNLKRSYQFLHTNLYMKNFVEF